MRAIGLLCLAIVLACASSPDRRIAADPEAFDGYPPEVQQQIRDGRVAVGFTEEQVRMALGEPDRKTEVTADDQVAHVWTWRRSTPGIGIGIGGGSYGGGVGIGTGISTGTGARSEDTRRIEFVNGVVTRIETLEE